MVLTKHRDSVYILVHHVVGNAIGGFPIGLLNFCIRVNEIVAVIGEPDLAQVIAC